MRSLALMFALLMPTAAPQENPVSVLGRRPSEWQRADPERWSNWDVGATPPAVVRPHLERVLAAYRADDVPRTLAALFDLLDVAPEYPPALHQAGTLYFRLRRYGDTIEALERYLRMAPDRVGDTRYLAHAYYSLGRYEDARDHYVKVVAKRKDSAEAHRGLGLSLMRLGEAAAALAELDVVLTLDPTHGNAATWVAQILFDEERIEDALLAVERARDLDPFEPRPWFLTGQILYDLGRDAEGDEAMARFDVLSELTQELRAIEGQLLLQPALPALHRRAVALHRQAGNVRAAGKALSRWLRADRQSIEVRVTMLDLATEVQDRKAAAAAASHLRRVAGDAAVAWEALLAYYRSVGDDQQAAHARSELNRLGRTPK